MCLCGRRVDGIGFGAFCQVRVDTCAEAKEVFRPIIMVSVIAIDLGHDDRPIETPQFVFFLLGQYLVVPIPNFLFGVSPIRDSGYIPNCRF